MFKEFYRKQLCVIPQKNGVATIPWKAYQTAFPSLGELDTFKGNEYGLVCGQISNVVVVDIDTADEAIINGIEFMTGGSPVGKFGSKGKSLFFKYNGETNHTWNKDGKLVCELLSNGRLTTIPPSPHRKTGKPYIWLGAALGDVELPSLPERFIALMDMQFPAPPRKVHVETYTNHEPVDLSEVTDMLRYISSDCSRNDWIAIGMALRDEFGDAAYSLWHSWSAQAATKYKPKDAQDRWRSFQSGGGVTIATLIWRAKEGGWERPFTPSIVQKRDSTVVESRSEMDRDGQVDSKAVQPITAHGLVGEIADYITRTAWRPQPLLSLGAALVFVGFLKGRNFITETNVYSNIYAFNIAGTACGKERPQSVLRTLIDDIGHRSKLLPPSASGTAFVDSLFSADGHGFMVIDEMGDYMACAGGKNAGSHQRKILKYWLEAFTATSTSIEGERRADAAKETHKIVKRPMFCLLGSTNPITLKSAMTGEDIGNGLLNRFLFFSSSESPRKKNALSGKPLPDETIDRMREYIETSKRPDEKLTVVPFTAEARELYNKIDNDFEDACQKLDINDRLRSLYGRVHEYVGKVALILSDDRKITLRDVEVAHAIVQRSMASALEFCGDIGDSVGEQDYIKVKDIIKKAGKIKLTRLYELTQRVQKKRRQEILEDLEGSGYVEFEQEVAAKGQKRPTTYAIWCNP